MYHFAICDDLQEDRSLIRSMLVDFAAERKQPISCAEYASGEALMAGCIGSGVRFDLIFLDIYMDGMDGMEVARVLREAGVEAVLVFLTTTPEFAVQSYEVGALSYLLKPVAPEKLVAVLDRFLALCRPRSVFLQGRLFLTGDIVSAESCNKTILLHFKTGTTAQLQGRLDEVEAALEERNFLRCHQSFIVNMDYVQCIQDDAFQTIFGGSVPIRKHGFSKIRKQYYEYITSL